MGAIRRDDVKVDSLFPGVQHRFAVNDNLGSPDCQMGEVDIAPGVGLAPHTHPVSDAMFVLAGEGVFILGEEEIPIHEGMFLVAPPNTRHGLRNTGDRNLRIVFTWPTGQPVPRRMVP